MQIIGKLTKGQVIQGPKGEYTSITVEEIKEYPNALKFMIFSKLFDVVEKMNDGDIVTVDFNTKINEFNGKTYNDISAWKILLKEKGNETKREEKQTTEKDELPF